MSFVRVHRFDKPFKRMVREEEFNLGFDKDGDYDDYEEDEYV